MRTLLGTDDVGLVDEGSFEATATSFLVWRALKV